MSEGHPEVHVSSARHSATSLLCWLAAGAVAAPVCTVVHESGHYLAGWLLDFPDLEFHGDAVSSSAAQGRYPSGQLGTMAVAGPLATLLLGVLFTVVALRWPGSLSIGFSLTDLARPLVMGPRYVLRLILQQGGSSSLGEQLPRMQAQGLDNMADETVAALNLGLPQATFVAGGFVIAAVLAYLVLARTRALWTIPLLIGLVLGAGLGLLTYLRLIVPWAIG